VTVLEQTQFGHKESPDLGKLPLAGSWFSKDSFSLDHYCRVVLGKHPIPGPNANAKSCILSYPIIASRGVMGDGHTPKKEYPHQDLPR
jgi:hypothetical protein